MLATLSLYKVKNHKKQLLQTQERFVTNIAKIVSGTIFKSSSSAVVSSLNIVNKYSEKGKRQK